MVIKAWYSAELKDTFHLLECDICKHRYTIKESQLPCDYSCPDCRSSELRAQGIYLINL